MNKKQLTIMIILGIITSSFLIMTTFKAKSNSEPKNVYQVYLDGEKIGLIENKDELLEMINTEQNDIKKQYNVTSVYPPNGFEIKEYVTYDEKISTVKDVYNQIKVKGDFTIHGTLITINKPLTDLEGNVEKTYIQVIDEKTFKDALEKVVLAFANESDYRNYINNTQEEIKDTGQIIKSMDLEEVITTKSANINVSTKIYTNSTELTQYLLFGTEQQASTYTIKQGDTIKSIAEANKLSVNEFLIANTKFKSEDSLLTIGDEVSIGLINPVVNMLEQVRVVEDATITYDKIEKIDNTKSAGYSEVIQQGVNGITRVTKEVQYENGQMSQSVALISEVPLIEKIDQITVVGKKQPNYVAGTGTCAEAGRDWGWPTKKPYTISSGYGYRGGEFHDAIDISGTGGRGSPIYASKEGIVVASGKNCADWSYGTCVIIQHDNNYHTMYAHMNFVNVSTGQSVSKGQLLGGMGDTGRAFGVHLHFGLYTGYPNYGGKVCDPGYNLGIY